MNEDEQDAEIARLEDENDALRVENDRLRLRLIKHKHINFAMIYGMGTGKVIDYFKKEGEEK